MLFLLTLTVFSCYKKPNYMSRISDLRTNVYYGESGKYSLTCYPEVRENPYLNDGYTGELCNVVIFKLKFIEDFSVTDSIGVSFCLNEKDYAAEFEYNSVSCCMTASIITDSLPVNSFPVYVNYQTNKTPMVLTSLLLKSTVSYTSAVDALASSSYTEAVNLLNEKNGDYELYARLIESDGLNYWYIGFGLGNNKIDAYLIDGETCEILARRQSA